MLSGIILGGFIAAGLTRSLHRYPYDYYPPSPLPGAAVYGGRPHTGAWATLLFLICLSVLILFKAGSPGDEPAAKQPAQSRAESAAGEGMAWLDEAPFHQTRLAEDALADAQPVAPEDTAQHYVQLNAFSERALAEQFAFAWPGDPQVLFSPDPRTTAPYKVLAGPFTGQHGAEAYLRRHAAEGLILPATALENWLVSP